jgi:asparagine synthase (glutamine-hydrolysing)
MRVVVQWGGGKESCTAYHKAVEQGYDVASLLTYVYMEPYIFHSFRIMELQSKALGTPQLKVKVKDSHRDIYEALTRLKKEEGIEGLVTGDIANVNHRPFYEETCKKLDLVLIMPLWDPSGDHFCILNEELSAGIRPVFSCIDIKYAKELNYFAEKWLGRELDGVCVKELKTLVDKYGIDPCGETPTPWYHTMVVDAPLFKETIEINKFSKKRKGSYFYMDAKEAFLRSKQ